MARQTKQQEPFAERERLEEQIRKLNRARADAERAAKAAEAEAKAIEQDRKALLADIANGRRGAKDKATDASAQIAAKEREAAEQRELAQVADDERRKVERELDELLSQHLDVFAAEAKELSVKAVADRQPVIDATETARASDAASRQAWARLVKAVRTQPEEPGATQFGERSGRDLGEMPPAPTALDSSTLDGLRTAPAPLPRFVRDVERARVYADRGIVPGAIKRLLGIGDKPTPEAKDEGGPQPFMEVA